jgi:acyl carrier protein
MRRSRDGRWAGDAVLLDLSRQLHDDARLVSGLATADTPDAARAVLDVLCSRLGVDEETIRRAASLRDLAGFDSFWLVDVIGRVEVRLGVLLPGFQAELPRDYSGLCRLFSEALAARSL